MEKASAEELLRRIQELEKHNAHIKQQLKLLDEPLVMKLTDSQYLNILQSMGQSLFIYDINHQIVFWNKGAETIYGYTFSEVIGRTPTELLAEPKDALFSQVILERTVRGESWCGEFPIKNKSGESFVVICANTPYRDENRNLLGAMCLSSDSRPYQVMKVGVCVTRTTFESSIASKISNLASKVKSKLKERENYMDDQSKASTPRGHITASPFGVFFSTNMEEHSSTKLSLDSGYETENKPSMISKILASKAEEWMDKKRIVWPWKLSNKSSKLDCQLSKDNIAASGLWSSTLHVSSTSSDDTNINVVREVDNIMDCEILWEDLITKQQIGQGSCATVYHALWQGSDVAVKLFTHQEYYYDNMIVPFKQEVSLMKRLRHPNVLLFMGAVTSRQHLCIVTEFLPRGSLFKILERNTTRLDWRRRIRMAMDIARGMNYLHCYNPPIIHRDLKSSNLLVDKNWSVKVGDFGLSRIRHQTFLNTKTGKGTPQWMAPEILQNEQADEKSDVYSYGVVLWEITTEKIPWEELHPMQVIAAVGFMNRKLQIPKNVDPLWGSLIERCCASEARSRPTFQEIIDTLTYLQNKFAEKKKGGSMFAS